MNPGGAAALADEIEAAEESGWTFSANRTARGLVYRAERRGRDWPVLRYDSDLRRLVWRCTTTPRRKGMT
jgi:hypothetical protein